MFWRWRWALIRDNGIWSSRPTLNLKVAPNENRPLPAPMHLYWRLHRPSDRHPL